MTSKSAHSEDVVIVTVDYGYDIHSVEIKRPEYEQIFRGEVVTIEGGGFSVEGKIESDSWTFNKEELGSVYVTTENLHEIYIGTIGDGNVTFDPDPNGLN